MKRVSHSVAQYLSSHLRVAMVSETYIPEVNDVSITVARMVEGQRQRGHLARARLTVERVTWSAIMGQLEKVLVNIANSQGANHVQIELSPER